MDAQHGSSHTLPGGVVMGIGILQEFPLIDGSHARHAVPHSNGHAGLSRETRARGALPNPRMRLLHFENTFGDVRVSEYCLDAMVSLVLLMTRNTKADAAKLARLTETASAMHPAENGFSRDAVRRAV
jgi:hypothetical protein